VVIVYDNMLNPVAGAQITIEDAITGAIVASGTTDSSGRFSAVLQQPLYIARVRVSTGNTVEEKLVIVDRYPYVVTVTIGGGRTIVKVVDRTLSPVSVDATVDGKHVVVGNAGLAIRGGKICIDGTCIVAENANEIVFILPETLRTTYYPPPVNTTLPPINGRVWLVVHATTLDGAPVKDATVTTSHTMLKPTDSWGYTYALLPTGTTRVSVSMPNGTLVYRQDVELKSNTILIVTMPYKSRYCISTLALLGMILLAWGLPTWNATMNAWELPVTVYLLLYSATPQQITLNLTLYNVTGDVWEASKTVTLQVGEGITELIDTLTIHFNETLVGHEIRGYAEITGFEEDTDTSDNAVWSLNTFILPTFCDLKLVLLYEPVKRSKEQWYLLPEDIIKIAIGVDVPAPLSIPAQIRWLVLSRNIRGSGYIYEKVGLATLAATEPKMYWINKTFVIPWTNKIVISASVYYMWDLCPFNNYDTIPLTIDADAKIESVEIPAMVTEGSTVTIKVKIVSNIPRGEKHAVLTIFDNTTGNILARVEVPLGPEVEVPVKIKVPENPPLSKYTPFLHEPTRMLQLAIVLDAADPKPHNNIRIVTMLVHATTLTIAGMAGIALIATLAVVGIVESVMKVVEDVRGRRMRFVRRKSFVERRG